MPGLFVIAGLIIFLSWILYYSIRSDRKDDKKKNKTNSKQYIATTTIIIILTLLLIGGLWTIFNPPKKSCDLLTFNAITTLFN